MRHQGRRRRNKELIFGGFLPLIFKLLMLSAILYYIYFWRSDKRTNNNIVVVNELPVALPEVDTTRTNKKYPNYEEYIALAKAQNYLPTDPTVKLSSTIEKYCQIFDIQEHYQETVDVYIAALEKEIRFLLGVFKQTIFEDSNRVIDLSSILLLALPAMHRTTYSVIKHRLRSNQSSSSLISQSAVLQMTGHWLYGPVREILQLWKDFSSNIIIDFSRTLEPDGYNILMRAVQFKLYGLISILGSLREDLLLGALPVAVVNGDDLALALLLRLIGGGASTNPTENTTKETSIALKDCIQLAAELGYDHVQERLNSHLKSLSSIEKVAFNHSSLPIYNDFAPFEMSLFEINSTATMEGSKTKKGNFLTDVLNVLRKKKRIKNVSECKNFVPEDSNGGYHPLRVFIETSSNSTENISERICKVSRMHISNISVEQFQRLFVRRNTPVLLQTDLTSSDSVRWNLSTILEKFGHLNISSSSIPFGALFGRKEHFTSLKEFVQDEGGMRAYSDQLSSFLGFHPASSPNSSIKLNASQAASWLLSNRSSAEINLPQYLFTEEIAAATQGDMMETIRQLRVNCSVSVDNAGECGNSNLEDLILSVGKALHFQFFLGPPLSGAPFHHHGPAFNVLVFGAKQWTLAPPGRDIYTNLHPLELDLAVDEQFEVYPFKRGPCKLLQQAGEVLFVPRHWSHQVLNLAESVGFAVEVSDYTH